MRGKELDTARMSIKREQILSESYRLFSEHGIANVTMPDIAKASDVGRATVFRYFGSKRELIIEVATWAWRQYRKDYRERINAVGFENMSAAEEFEIFLDSFLDLYRNHKRLLRFNQYFNIYVKDARVSSDQMEPYMKMIGSIAGRFHSIYVKAELDGTIRTDVSENMMFTSTLHIMLATVTRYAVGLVYVPDEETGPEQELVMLKDMLLDRYRTKKK